MAKKNKKKVLTLETIQKMSRVELNKSRSVMYISKLFAVLQNEFPSMLGNYIVVTGSQIEELGAQGVLELCDLSDLSEELITDYIIPDLNSVPPSMRGLGNNGRMSMAVQLDSNLIMLNDFSGGLSISQCIHEIAHITTSNNGKVFTTTAHGYTHIINKLNILGLDQMFLNGTIAERRYIIDKAIHEEELIVASLEYSINLTKEELVTAGVLDLLDLCCLNDEEISYTILTFVTDILSQNGFEKYQHIAKSYKKRLINLELEGSDVI